MDLLQNLPIPTKPGHGRAVQGPAHPQKRVKELERKVSECKAIRTPTLRNDGALHHGGRADHGRVAGDTAKFHDQLRKGQGGPPEPLETDIATTPYDVVWKRTASS